MCRALVRLFPYLDGERVAVRGTSYGGFLAGSMLANRQDRLLKCGVLVAPIIDWRLTGTRGTRGFHPRLKTYRYQGYSWLPS